MVKKMTLTEWETLGEQLFGKDRMKWKFVCPGCGNIQSVEEFRKYKDQGAEPSSAYQKCIGRYAGGKSWMNDPTTKKGPCDYTANGLLNICPLIVVDNEGHEHTVFDFYQEKACIHEWGTDGLHLNVFCKKCFIDKPK